MRIERGQKRVSLVVHSSDSPAPLRLGVVGYGYWGSKHARVLSGLPAVAVTVIDPDPLRRAEAETTYPSVRTEVELGAALRRADGPDAFVVATPPATHAPVARRILHARRPVLVEKPLTTSVADAEELVDLAQRTDTTLMVGHTFEYNPAVWKLKEIVDSGELGRILYIDTARLSLGRYQRDCNVIWDLAPHDISIVSYLLGEMPSSVSVWARPHVSHQPADVAYLNLAFAGADVHAYVHVSWLDPCKVRRTTVVGEHKMAVYNDLSDNERVRVYDTCVTAPSPDPSDASGAMPVTYRNGDIVSPYISFTEPLRNQDAHFVDCVRRGTTPVTPGRCGLEVVRVLTATDDVLADKVPVTKAAS